MMRIHTETRHIDEQLRRTMWSHGYRKWLAVVTSLPLPVAERDALAAILLVEMTSRSAAERFLEWVVRAAIPAFRSTRRLRPWTVGPLQLHDAPRDFVEAVRRSRRVIDGCVTDDDLARKWHGSAERRSGSCISYAEALSKSRVLIRPILEGDRRGVGSTDST